jgi:hypothetical protein
MQQGGVVSQSAWHAVRADIYIDAAYNARVSRHTDGPGGFAATAGVEKPVTHPHCVQRASVTLQLARLSGRHVSTMVASV